jgi:hypothetical protein
MSRAIIYVYLQNNLPQCFWSSLQKTRELWQGDIYLIAPQRERDYQALKTYDVKFIPEESFKDKMIEEYEKYTFFNTAYRDWNGFWDTACKRFLYIYLVQSQYEIDEIIHIETDVVPYMDIDKMFDAFKSVYNKKLVFTPHALYQFNCNVIYCDAIETLRSFCTELIVYFKKGIEYFKNIYPGQSIISETHLAYTFWHENKDKVDLFPTMPSDKSELEFLVDPQSWGLWLDGVDRNPKKQYATNKYYIGSKILNGKYDIHFSYKEGKIKQPFVYDIETQKSYPLAILHFHSKRPEQWI